MLQRVQVSSFLVSARGSLGYLQTPGAHKKPISIMSFVFFKRILLDIISNTSHKEGMTINWVRDQTVKGMEFSITTERATRTKTNTQTHGKTVKKGA